MLLDICFILSMFSSCMDIYKILVKFLQFLYTTLACLKESKTIEFFFINYVLFDKKSDNFFVISAYDPSQCDYGPILASLAKVSK